jgi:hypothetical protein
MLFDVSRRYPRAIVHRHKLHVRPNGFTAEWKFEIKNLINQVNRLVVGNAPEEDLTVTFPPPSRYGGGDDVCEEAHLLAPSSHNM